MKEDQLGRPCNMHERKEKHVQNVTCKIEGDSPLGRQGRRWQENMKTSQGSWLGWCWVD